MTERVLLIEGVDYKVTDGERVRVSAAGLASRPTSVAPWW
jgi:hypothetical protein